MYQLLIKNMHNYTCVEVKNLFTGDTQFSNNIVIN